MHVKDVNYLVDLVIAKKVCVKSFKVENQGNKSTQVKILDYDAILAKKV